MGDKNYEHLKNALDDRALLCVRRDATLSAYHYSFMVVYDGAKWDYTEAIAEALGYDVRKKNCMKTILTKSPVHVLQEYFKLFDTDLPDGYDGYAQISEKIVEI